MGVSGKGVFSGVTRTGSTAGIWQEGPGKPAQTGDPVILRGMRSSEHLVSSFLVSENRQTAAVRPCSCLLAPLPPHRCSLSALLQHRRADC